MSSADEVGMGLLQVLYFNMDRAPGYPASQLAQVLEFESQVVETKLEELISSGLIDRVKEGFRISEKGYFAASQHERSACPYL